ncbi:TonB-dependent receptor, partial [candidate division KSB1 bacterium]|nr:TonB-dependent receptor [candidate division KSB1 bacterium]
MDGKKEEINAILENPEFFSDEYNILTGSAGSADNALDVKANNRNYTSTGFQTILGLESGSEETTLHQIEIGFRYHKDEVDRFQWVDTYSMDNGIMKLNQAGVPGTESNRIGTA